MPDKKPYKIDFLPVVLLYLGSGLALYSGNKNFAALFFAAGTLDLAYVLDLY